MTYLKRLLNKLIEHYVLAMATGLLSASLLVAGIYDLWEVLINFMFRPVPIWSFVFVALIIFLIFFFNKYFIKYKQAPRVFFIEDSNFKWKVTDFKNGAFDIEYIPYCPKHEFRLIKSPGGQYLCREVISTKCDSKIVNVDELGFLNQMAKSKAEYLVDNE